jgi:shikimate kinase
MPLEAPIFLIGFMTSGKSSVGRVVAERLGWAFADLDQVVTAAAQASVAQIFASEGEAGFRRREAQAVAAASGWTRTVVATGGGAACHEESLRLMLQAGRVVALEISPEEVVRRANGGAGRPLLAGATDPLAVVTELLRARAPFYARAHHRVVTDGLAIDAVAANVLEVLDGFPVPREDQAPPRP